MMLTILITTHRKLVVVLLNAQVSEIIQSKGFLKWAKTLNFMAIQSCKDIKKHPVYSKIDGKVMFS